MTDETAAAAPAPETTAAPAAETPTPETPAPETPEVPKEPEQTEEEKASAQKVRDDADEEVKREIRVKAAEMKELIGTLHKKHPIVEVLEVGLIEALAKGLH